MPWVNLTTHTHTYTHLTKRTRRTSKFHTQGDLANDPPAYLFLVAVAGPFVLLVETFAIQLLQLYRHLKPPSSTGTDTLDAGKLSDTDTSKKDDAETQMPNDQEILVNLAERGAAVATKSGHIRVGEARGDPARLWYTA